MEKRVKYAKIFLKESGKILLRYLKKKNLEDLQKADKKVEAYIIGSIFNRYPIDSISTEKTGEIIKSSKYRWIIAPLEGKSEYLSENSLFFISIKIEESGVVKGTLIYLPIFNELLYQSEGNLFLNDEEILESNKEKLIHFHAISKYLEKNQWNAEKSILN